MSSYQSKCPRCHSHAYENFSSHSYCPDCLYSPELDTHFQKSKGIPIREAESYIKPAEVHSVPKKSKKSSEEAS